MKANRTIYKSFLAVFLAIILPLSGNFLIFEAAASPSQPLSSQSVQPPNVIKVVQAMPAFEIAPTLRAATAAIGAECLAVGESVGNGIQGQAIVNLNQPANCFSLVEHAALAKALPKISVSGLLYQNVKISVLTLPGTVIKFLNSAHLPKDFPAAIPAAAALVLVYGVIAFQIKRSILKFSAAPIFAAEPANEFVILRC